MKLWQILTLTILIIILFFSFRSSTPKIDGPNSIASIESVELNDTKQWIVLRGENKDNPVLLWVDGGPGGTEIGYTRRYLSELEKDFVFVNWDQRGTGKSYAAVKDFSTLTVDDFVGDLIALSEQLKDRFSGRKIYLVGHSWGSIIGMMAVAQRPDLYEAYIGVGQQVNADENDVVTYERIINNASKAGDNKTIEALKVNGLPPYKDNNGITKISLKGIEFSKYMFLFSKIFNYADTAKYDGMAMLSASEQNFWDKINLFRGLIKGVDLVYPQLVGFNFEKDIPEVGVPAYFLIGREDYTTNQDMAYSYYEKLIAPEKNFFWFEGFGHNNCYEDPDRFISIIRDEILNK